MIVCPACKGNHELDECPDVASFGDAVESDLGQQQVAQATELRPDMFEIGYGVTLEGGVRMVHLHLKNTEGEPVVLLALGPEATAKLVQYGYAAGRQCWGSGEGEDDE